VVATRTIRSARHRLAVVLVILVVVGAVVAHHAMPEMSGMAATVMCLAVLAVAVTVSAVGALRRPTWRPLLAVALPHPAIVRVCGVPARAGPLHLVLLVLRR
jgi:hypothetical protein